jgi:diguanylate cyclase (GGDEF)-like protein
MYLVRTTHGVYEAGGWYDAGWWAGLTLIAAAAWQTPPTRRARFTGDSLRLLIAPLVSGAVGLELLVYASMGDLNPLAVGLASAALVFVMIRLTLTFRQNVGILRASRDEALTDALTGLGNRRALTRELDDALPVAQPETPLVLALFDLDGFKHYNDTFGHPAGDILLARLGGNLRAYFGNRARVFRMGGDEFCALFEPRGADVPATLDGAALALSEQGDGFWIGCSYGSVTLPRETADASEALRIADQRMYAQKHAGRMSAARQVKEALIAALAARDPRLEADARALADVAEAAARTLGLNRDERETVRLAAELHQVGRLVATTRADVAIASRRIVAAAPSLAPVARLLHLLDDDDAPRSAQIVAVAAYGADTRHDAAVVAAVAAAQPALV